MPLTGGHRTPQRIALGMSVRRWASGSGRVTVADAGLEAVVLDTEFVSQRNEDVTNSLDRRFRIFT